jgi:hypothetical protein
MSFAFLSMFFMLCRRNARMKVLSRSACVRPGLCIGLTSYNVRRVTSSSRRADHPVVDHGATDQIDADRPRGEVSHGRRLRRQVEQTVHRHHTDLLQRLGQHQADRRSADHVLVPGPVHRQPSRVRGLDLLEAIRYIVNQMDRYLLGAARISHWLRGPHQTLHRQDCCLISAANCTATT